MVVDGDIRQTYVTRWRDSCYWCIDHCSVTGPGDDIVIGDLCWRALLVALTLI